jgi:hypothetical protein
MVEEVPQHQMQVGYNLDASSNVLAVQQLKRLYERVPLLAVLAPP